MVSKVNLDATADLICDQCTQVSDAKAISAALEEEKIGHAREGVLLFLSARLEELQSAETTRLLNGPLNAIVGEIASIKDADTLTRAIQTERQDRNRASVVDMLQHQLKKARNKFRCVF
jgi:hypothetical protein